MTVKVLAFCDTRFQSSPAAQRWGGGWPALAAAHPASHAHPPLGLPAGLGCYDLAQGQSAAQVVALARAAGIDGFVVDCRWDGADYWTGALALAPFTDETFGLAYLWRNEEDAFWCRPAGMAERQERAERLIRALAQAAPAPLAGRVVLIVDRPAALSDVAESIALLREAAAAQGLPGLYLLANGAKPVEWGYDAALDPGPAEWQVSSPSNRPDGFALLEIMAGLKDSVEAQDRFYPYTLFVVSRMVRRDRRGKAMPRVFPGYYDWPAHPNGGATLLTHHGGKPVEPYWFELFLENAMLLARHTLPQGEQAVFLQSWNGWLEGSQIEPSQQEGDLVYNAARKAIARARYILKTQAPGEGAPLPEAVRQRLDWVLEAAGAIVAETGRGGSAV